MGERQPRPHCGNSIGDLDDYTFVGMSERAEDWCDSCDGPIVIERAVSVSYSIKKRPESA